MVFTPCVTGGSRRISVWPTPVATPQTCAGIHVLHDGAFGALKRGRRDDDVRQEFLLFPDERFRVLRTAVSARMSRGQFDTPACPRQGVALTDVHRLGLNFLLVPIGDVYAEVNLEFGNVRSGCNCV